MKQSLAIIFLFTSVWACGGRTVSLDDAAGGKDQWSVPDADAMLTESSLESGDQGPFAHCGGADKMILHGEQLSHNKVYASDKMNNLFISLRNVDSGISSLYYGIFIRFNTPSSFKVAENRIDLSNLPPDWTIKVYRFSGGCKDGKKQCPSNAGPIVSKSEPYRILDLAYRGVLQISAGPNPKVTLCLLATDLAGTSVLKFYVHQVRIH